jgi:hypothetical protein
VVLYCFQDGGVLPVTEGWKDLLVCCYQDGELGRNDAFCDGVWYRNDSGCSIYDAGNVFGEGLGDRVGLSLRVAAQRDGVGRGEAAREEGKSRQHVAHYRSSATIQAGETDCACLNSAVGSCAEVVGETPDGQRRTVARQRV